MTGTLFPSGAAHPGAAHPSAAAIDAHAAGALTPAGGAAIDLHVQSCLACRFALNQQSVAHDPARVARNLLAIEAELDAPPAGVVECSLARLGFSAETARLLAATPSLRRSWFIAIGLVLFFGLAAANPDRPDASLAWFLALAPLLPVMGVALAYGPGVDPSYEMTLAAPMSGFRLVLVRAAAVLATAIACTGVTALLLVRAHAAMVAAWLIPAFALTALCLAVMTRLPPRVAGAVVAGGWLVLAIAVGTRGTDGLALFRWVPQVVMLGVGIAAATFVLARRRAFDTGAGALA